MPIARTTSLLRAGTFKVYNHRALVINTLLDHCWAETIDVSGEQSRRVGVERQQSGHSRVARKQTKLVSLETSLISYAIRSPKDSVLRRDWLRMTEPRFIVVRPRFLQRSEFSQCEPILLQEEIFGPPHCTKI